MSSVTRARVRGKRLILAYHGVIPTGEHREGEHALFIDQKGFAEHLDMLRRVADVAPLDRLDEEGDGRPRIAITIDDAYRGAVQQGVDELAKRKLPATIFVAPGRLDGHAFWWDCLASDSGILDERLRDHALAALDGNDEKVRAWAGKKELPTNPVSKYARAASRTELRNAVARPGITVGSHTWSHANLATLGAEKLYAELVRSRAWLREEFAEKSIDWLAYPYGLYSAAAQIAASDASYVGALSIDGGWHNPSEVSAFARPRLNVPAGLSVSGLEARVIGALRV